LILNHFNDLALSENSQNRLVFFPQGLETVSWENPDCAQAHGYGSGWLSAFVGYISKKRTAMPS
jgi:hypothetical protein